MNALGGIAMGRGGVARRYGYTAELLFIGLETGPLSSCYSIKYPLGEFIFNLGFGHGSKERLLEHGISVTQFIDYTHISVGMDLRSG